jgi:hypothetical protein
MKVGPKLSPRGTTSDCPNGLSAHNENAQVGSLGFSNKLLDDNIPLERPHGVRDGLRRF